MLKNERCPYCGHKVSHAEYEKVRAKVERELRSRLDKELAVERKKVQQERDALRRDRQATRAEARSWAKDQVKQATASLRAQVDRLRDAQDATHEEGVEVGKREGRRSLERAEKQIAVLQRELSRKTSDEFGDWSEQDLHDALSRAFPEDKIVRLPKGDGGADIAQEVRYRGRPCGTLALECKNVKEWSNSFIGQAKRGAERLDTEHAIIVSTAFPKKAKGFAMLKGVPIVVPTGALAFVEVLRGSLIEMERRGLSTGQRVEKSKALYEYLRGTSFRASMQSIVDAATELEEIQKRERKAHEQVWTQQASHLSAIVNRTGQVQGKVVALLEETPEKSAAKVEHAAAGV